jgi:geranylgeranyl diphosphate synthase type II
MNQVRTIVPEMLDEYGRLVRDAMQDYLPDREPRRYLYQLVADYPNRGGKMMRPSLCLATARALGGTLDEALRSAVSLELLHNALLIHDDIEDESTERRGHPTMHMQHGIAMAINAGDTLTLLSLRPLFENADVLGPKLAARVFEETERVAVESAEGQALELGWRLENVMNVTESDYLTMVLKKTCWLATIYPMRVGALIGSRGAVDLDRFMRFGFFLGAAFQIQDDLLNLYADQQYGKEKEGDIWEAKRTLMLIRLIESCDAAERARIEAALATSREERQEDDVRWIRAMMDHYNCLDYARQVAHGLAGAALEEFAAVYRGVPDSRDKRFIEALSTWVFHRT